MSANLENNSTRPGSKSRTEDASANPDSPAAKKPQKPKKSAVTKPMTPEQSSEISKAKKNSVRLEHDTLANDTVNYPLGADFVVASNTNDIDYGFIERERNKLLSEPTKKFVKDLIEDLTPFSRVAWLAISHPNKAEFTELLAILRRDVIIESSKLASQPSKKPRRKRQPNQNEDQQLEKIEAQIWHVSLPTLAKIRSIIYDGAKRDRAAQICITHDGVLELKSILNKLVDRLYERTPEHVWKEAKLFQVSAHDAANIYVQKFTHLELTPQQDRYLRELSAILWNESRIVQEPNQVLPYTQQSRQCAERMFVAAVYNTLGPDQLRNFRLERFDILNPNYISIRKLAPVNWTSVTEKLGLQAKDPQARFMLAVINALPLTSSWSDILMLGWSAISEDFNKKDLRDLIALEGSLKSFPNTVSASTTPANLIKECRQLLEGSLDKFDKAYNANLLKRAVSNPYGFTLVKDVAFETLETDKPPETLDLSRIGRLGELSVILAGIPRSSLSRLLKTLELPS